VSAYTEADVDRLAQVIDNAREAGIHHGNYTLARWILDRWPVQGSTPEDKLIDEVITDAGPGSTPLEDGEAARPVVANLAKIRYLGETLLAALQPLADATNDMVERLGQTPGSTPLDSPAPAVVHRCPPYGSSIMPCCGRSPFEVPSGRIAVDPALVTCAAPAGEVVSVPPPAPAPAAEPVPVPPPVDALLVLVDEHACWEAERAEWHQALMADERSGVPSKIPTYRVDRAEKAAALCRGRIAETLRALWAAGLEEGRQQSAGQLKKERESFGRLALLYDGAVSDGDARYAAGVAEGLRQATEERTKIEYGVRVDAVHPLRREKVGTVMTHFGEQKSRMCHDIWDGWTPVKRTVLPAVHGRWEALDEAERLVSPWKRDAEAADHG
jgi:hypothetical protein